MVHHYLCVGLFMKSAAVIFIGKCSIPIVTCGVCFFLVQLLPEPGKYSTYHRTWVLNVGSLKFVRLGIGEGTGHHSDE